MQFCQAIFEKEKALMENEIQDEWKKKQSRKAGYMILKRKVLKLAPFISEPQMHFIAHAIDFQLK